MGFGLNGHASNPGVLQQDIQALLRAFPGLRLQPSRGGVISVAGGLAFEAEAARQERLRDEYEVRITIPVAYPEETPIVEEVGGRIPHDYHHLSPTILCLASPLRLQIVLSSRPTILEFVLRVVVPYFYGYTYYLKRGVTPFGELSHGRKGVIEDLADVLAAPTNAVAPLLSLGALRKRVANKRRCPCGSGRRLGRCHHLLVNGLRRRMTRSWFRTSLDLIQSRANANSTRSALPHVTPNRPIAMSQTIRASVLD